MISNVASVGVPVTDQDEAVAFFVDVLGFEKRVDVPLGDGRRWIEVAPQGADTVLTPYTWVDHHGDQVGGFSRVVLRCDDLGALYADLLSRGVEFELAPQDSLGGQFAHFKDPFGNVYVLAQLP
jgi:catechol 2,3-dioxygenase-like lactoylglutathione lyase family enzyme